MPRLVRGQRLERVGPGLHPDRLRAARLGVSNLLPAPRLQRASADGRGIEGVDGRPAEEQLVAVAAGLELVSRGRCAVARRPSGCCARPRTSSALISPSTSSHPRRTRTSPASKSTSSTWSARSSPRLMPANSASAQNACSDSGRAGDQRLRGRGSLDAGAVVAHDGQLQPGRTGSTSSSSLSIALRTITRRGSSRLCTAEGAAPRPRISSTKPCTSARRSVLTFRLPSSG